MSTGLVDDVDRSSEVYHGNSLTDTRPLQSKGVLGASHFAPLTLDYLLGWIFPSLNRITLSLWFPFVLSSMLLHVMLALELEKACLEVTRHERSLLKVS
jgi:hypothetical protein